MRRGGAGGQFTIATFSISQLTPDEWRTMRALEGDIAKPDASTVMQIAGDRRSLRHGPRPDFDVNEVVRPSH